MKKYNYLLLLGLGLINTSPIKSIFQGKNLNFTSQTFNASDRLIASEKIDIKSGYLFGNGTIDGPTIDIVAGTFEFTGTINCSQTCKIITAEPFDHSIFTQTGGGTFIFEVQPDLFQKNTEATKKTTDLSKENTESVNYKAQKSPEEKLSAEHNKRLEKVETSVNVIIMLAVVALTAWMFHLEETAAARSGNSLFYKTTYF